VRIRILNIRGRALNTLQALAENAVDASDGSAGTPDLRLAGIYADCHDHVLLMDEDEQYAAFFRDRVFARNAAHVRAELAAADGLEQQLQEKRFDTAHAAPVSFQEAVARWGGNAPKRAPGTVRAFAAAAELIQATPDVRTLGFDIQQEQVEATIVKPDVPGARAILNMLGDRFGLAYGEHGIGDWTTLRAAGEIAAVEVGFKSSCRTKDVDEAGPTPQWTDLPKYGDGAGADRRFRHLLLAAGLHGQVSDVYFWWSVETDGISAMLPMTDDRFTRAVLPALAGRLGFSYTEEEAPSHGPGALKAMAWGDVDGVPVELWAICDRDALAGDAEQQDALYAEARDDVWSASEQFEHDQACEAAADYAASLEPGLEADL
jgi:hypothetical protein